MEAAFIQGHVYFLVHRIAPRSSMTLGPAQTTVLRPVYLSDGTGSLLLHRTYYGHMTVSPDLYPASGHMMMSPDVYQLNGYLPTPSNEQHQGSSYLPSVSYSLDHLDRLDYQVILFD